MLVIRMWTTREERLNPQKKFYVGGNGYYNKTSEWVGLFLFGFIPLLIKQASTTYDNNSH